MKELKGISASPGIALGRVFLYIDDTLKVPKYDITDDEVVLEFERFTHAVEKAAKELNHLKQQTSSEMGEEQSRFLDSHLLMLSDPEFHNQINHSLKDELKNVEWVLSQVIEGIIEKLNFSQDVYLRERTLDIHDVSKRVLNHLLYRERISLHNLAEEVVLVTHNLLPSDALAMNKRMIKGIVMDAGGKTSHTAILARSFEIPAVLGLSDITRYARSGDEIIVDGNAGKVIINPEEKTRQFFYKSFKEWQKREVQLLNLNDLLSETKDGKRVELKANIEVAEELDSVLSHGADGIGLYRSEFMFLKPGAISSEEEQYEAYSTVLKGMQGKPVTIRTLDVGGDKTIPEIRVYEEKNPLLGWRAVRFCLSRPALFKKQLRAMLRASIHGDLRIMFPMISGIEELDKILAILEETKVECRRDGIGFKENIPIGIMIEVPSAALTADILAKRVDFFSIGTNDLIQYTIAVDRGNEKIAYLYEPFHPGVLRLIRMVVDSAHSHGIPVSMCGEMAGDPLATVILLGLGLDEYSMSSSGIPEIKQIIRAVSMLDAEELVGNIMEMKSYNEIDPYVRGWMNERFKHFNY